MKQLISGMVYVVNAALVWPCVLLLSVWHYAISPLLGTHCRFYPTCSQYAVDALKKHGFLRGSLLSMKRVLRCSPRFEGGYDPVPETL